MIPAILSFVVILVWDLVTDYRRWLANKPINHTDGALVRMLLMIFPSASFAIEHTPQFNLLVLFNVVLMEFFLFWLLFDGIYNLLRGYGWWFAGSDDEDDPLLDDLIQKYPVLIAVVKIGGSIAFTTIYILTYGK